MSRRLIVYLTITSETLTTETMIENGYIASVTELYMHDCILLVFGLFQDTPCLNILLKV